MNNRTILPILKDNAATGYQDPVQIELLIGATINCLFDTCRDMSTEQGLMEVTQMIIREEIERYQNLLLLLWLKLIFSPKRYQISLLSKHSSHYLAQYHNSNAWSF